jgi:hypothetical protein
VTELLQTRVEERLEPPAKRPGVRERNDEAQVHEPRRHRIQDGVIGRIDVDLAHVIEPVEPRDVLDQRHPLQAMRTHEPERAGHDGRAAVGAHDKRAGDLEGSP